MFFLRYFNIMELWLAIVIIVVVAIIAFIIGGKFAIHPDIISNEEQEKALQNILLERNKQEQLIAEFNQKIEGQKEKYQEIQQYVQDANVNVEQIYKNKTTQLEDQYKIKQEQLNQENQETLKIYKQQQEKEKQELESLRATKAAAIEAARKEELIHKTQEDYCLRISTEEQNDVAVLNGIRNKITKPRAISMVIGSQYYQPIAKKLFPKILGSENVCGIYKITNQKTGECYIGQAKDIRKRWNEHSKYGLAIDTPQGNKLYKAMLEYGLEYFSFELLEQCPPEKLNEKERFFISLYSADTLGYNGNKGVG